MIVWQHGKERDALNVQYSSVGVKCWASTAIDHEKVGLGNAEIGNYGHYLASQPRISVFFFHLNQSCIQICVEFDNIFT